MNTLNIEIRHVNPADQNPRRIRKIVKDFSRELHLKDLKFPVKTKDLHKSKKRIESALLFLVMKTR